MDRHEEAQVVLTPALSSAASSGDLFMGTDRKASKTSIAQGAIEDFSDIASLRVTLASDGDMINTPGISKAPDNQRTPPEQRNARVHAFLFAAAKEKDNDFHLILGTGAGGNTDALMNSEISGLPSDATFLVPLTTVRDQFKAHFGSDLPGRTYALFDPPIPVIVTGSLFFDLDHQGGTVGPGALKPSSAWEIHPITEIVFEP
jgi:hypothetical protein